MRADVVSRRALSRATLARQLLLERADHPVPDAVEHLVGLQAQVPGNPYVALWSRLSGFDPETLEQLLLERAVVRIVLMRGTIHLVTAADCLGLRALFQPVLDAELVRHRDYAPQLRGVDLAPVLSAARAILAEQPRTGPQLRAALADRFPDRDPAALAYACRNHLALVQVPPRGLWHRSGAVTTTTAEAWLGRAPDPAPSIDDLVVRYFAAFGPATVADVATWTRLTGLREVVDRLGPRLRRFRDEHGRDLFDVPHGARPDPAALAPARFLPEYDNVLLSHADRTRFGSDERRARLASAPRKVEGCVLHGGEVRGTWRIERDGERAVLTVDHDGLTKRAASAIASEGKHFLDLVAADAIDRDVRLVALP
jgi:hypothetical protein